MNTIALLSSAGQVTRSAVSSGSFSDWFATQLSSFTPMNVAAVLAAGLAVYFGLTRGKERTEQK